MLVAVPLFGQDSTNCFLNDYIPKKAIIPLSVDVNKPAGTAQVVVTINTADTLGKISQYVFGNAVAVWVGPNQDNPALLKYLNMLSPTLIRFPGGSWSDIYFWDKLPDDIPGTIPDGTTYNYSTGSYNNISLYPQAGPWYSLTPDNYYSMRSQLGTQGLITINYAYARYGLSDDPVNQAAHEAANWVRYDAGQTEFWEIGNENAGPWEAGWLIDTTQNKDHQPALITGDLYGKHFKIFADSMKAAAAENGNHIYIGGQILHFDASNDSDIPNRTWNQEFFNQVGDSADFYVMHNYYGGTYVTGIQLMYDRSTIEENLSYIQQDIADNHASPKPIAITEWNIGGSSPQAAITSTMNGMDACLLINEMIKYNVGMACRWLIATGETGMFYNGSNTSIPLWNPRPDFFYLYYLQRFTGDHVISASVNGSQDIYAYASMFASGHQGVVVINKGVNSLVVDLNPVNFMVGDKYYIYSLNGGDNINYPQSVLVNNFGPSSSVEWGPLDSLTHIPASAYQIGNEIKFISPASSVQFIMIEPGNRVLTAVNELKLNVNQQFKLNQNYPNPFNPATAISYYLPKQSIVTIKIYDIMGREVAVPIRNKNESAGDHQISFNAANLTSGVYFYKITAGSFSVQKKMILMK
jgi:hypothetical protein